MAEKLPELPPVITNKGYKLVERVAGGGFSTVYKATCSRKDMVGKELAAKIIDLSNVNQTWLMKNLKNEMKIIKILKHPNIVRVYDLVKTTSFAYIFMDLAKNGCVLDKLTKDKKPLTEQKAKRYMTDIVNGLVYIHSRGIAHRDIKPDNFLIDSNDRIMISDFGFACIALNNSVERIMKGTSCGTAEYMAIEIKTKNDGEVYDAKATDIYSLGISLYLMTFFDLPYNPQNEVECLRKQKSRDYRVKSKFYNISQNLKELLYSLLDPNPKTRPTAREILKYQWFTTE